MIAYFVDLNNEQEVLNIVQIYSCSTFVIKATTTTIHHNGTSTLYQNLIQNISSVL